MTTEISRIFLDHSTGKLEQMMDMLEKYCAMLSEEQIWGRPHDGANSVANLLMHLEGNLGQWIGHYLGGLPDVRERDREFEMAGDLDKTTLLQQLRTRLFEAVQIISNLSDEQLTGTVETTGGPRTGLGVVYQVVGHFQQHAGQIVYAVKQGITA